MKLLVVLTLLIAISFLSFAQPANTTVSPTPQPQGFSINIPILSDIYREVTAVPGKMVDALVNFISKLVSDLANAITEPMFMVAKYNPNLTGNSVLRETWAKVAVGSGVLFAFALSWYGLQMVAAQMFSEAQRAEAKEKIKRLFLGIILIPISFEAYAIMASFFSALAAWLAPATGGKLITVVNVGAAALLATALSVALLPIAIAFLLSLIVRIALVMVFAVLSPLIIFLYFFDKTHDFGNTLVNLALANFLIQPVVMIVLAVGLGLQGTIVTPGATDTTTAIIQTLLGFGVTVAALFIPYIFYVSALKFAVTPISSAYSTAATTFSGAQRVWKRAEPSVSAAGAMYDRRVAQTANAHAAASVLGSTRGVVMGLANRTIPKKIVTSFREL